MDLETKDVFVEEKGSLPVTSLESYLDVREQDKVQRRLRQRHVQMCVATFLLSLPVHSDSRKGLP